MIVTALIAKTVKIYFYILQGYLAGRVFKIDRVAVSALLFYLITPMIFLTSIPSADLSEGALLLPVIVFLICALFGAISLHFGKRFWPHNVNSIVAYAAGNGNTGYFGLPIAAMLFPEEIVGVYVTAILGIVFYENTIGYFLTVRSHHTKYEAFIRVIKLPVLWASLAGLLMNFLGLKFPEEIHGLSLDMRSVYLVLGMMIIGLGLSGIKKIEFDPLFLVVTLGTKYLVWPIFSLLLVLIDQNIFHMFNDFHYKILLLMSIMPMATNAVTVATLLNISPEKVATSVMISILVALIYIPYMLTLLFEFV